MQADIKVAHFPDFISEVRGLSIRELVSEYGTPLYLYDLDKMKNRVEELKRLGTVRYAVKANSSLKVLSFLRSSGVFADCVSEGEVKRALRAGWKNGKTVNSLFPSEVVYTCDIFDHGSLALVASENITVNCGSIDMISQLGSYKREHPDLLIDDRITLRINPGFGHGHSQKTNTGGQSSKHGIWFEDLNRAIQVARENGLHVAGLHLHIGSGSDFEHLHMVCEAIQSLALKIGSSLEMISVGGGLPTPYRSGELYFDYERFIDVCLAAKANVEAGIGKKLTLEVEPGRYLVADSGYLIAEIRAIKRMGDLTYYLVDAGFNDLARPVMYGSYHHISLLSDKGEALDSDSFQDVVVAGPLCESGDVFTQEEGGFVATRSLPRARVGDFLVFHTAGAYGASMSSNYNSRPYCPEIVIEDGQAKLARPRGKVEDLYKDELF
ncbi:MAG TPA: diaminopimelate decarboxylase [Oligoflexia bacterium]|nr:diaminopimelate decarboxylase [Oligoflexia bacterium]HMP48868.1 diaminopimelate decarboxylase [Oligoflexia bacterium]